MSEFFKAAMVPMGVFPTKVAVSDAMMVTGSVRQGKLESLSPAAVQAAYLRRLRSLHSSQRTPSSSILTQDLQLSFNLRLHQWALPNIGT